MPQYFWVFPQLGRAVFIRGLQLSTDMANEIVFVEHAQSQSITGNMVLRSERTGTLVPDGHRQAGDATSSVELIGPLETQSGRKQAG